MTTAADNNDSKDRGVNWAGIICLSAVGLILLWAGMIGLKAWYHGEYAAELESKVVERVSPELQAAETAQRAMISGYEYVDRENDHVRLPIDRAMELVVQESKEVK